MSPPLPYNALVMEFLHSENVSVIRAFQAQFAQRLALFPVSVFEIVNYNLNVELIKKQLFLVSDKAVMPRTVALFVNEIDSLRESSDSSRAQSNADLVFNLKNQGYAVTVIYVGASSPSFSSLASKFADKGVFLLRYGTDYFFCFDLDNFI